MYTSNRIHVAAIAVIAATVLAACSVQPPAAKPPALGAAVSAEEVARWDISIPPSGAGLPPGNGSVSRGKRSTRQSASRVTGLRVPASPQMLW